MWAGLGTSLKDRALLGLDPRGARWGTERSPLHDHPLGTAGSRLGCAARDAPGLIPAPSHRGASRGDPLPCRGCGSPENLSGPCRDLRVPKASPAPRVPVPGALSKSPALRLAAGATVRAGAGILVPKALTSSGSRCPGAHRAVLSKALPQGPQCPMSGVPGGLPRPGGFGLLEEARRGHPKLFWEAPLGLYVLNPAPNPQRGSRGGAGAAGAATAEAFAQ